MFIALLCFSSSATAQKFESKSMDYSGITYDPYTLEVISYLKDITVEDFNDTMNLTVF